MIYLNTCKVIAVFDCCHSGTILDLKYKYINSITTKIENKNKFNNDNIYLISGCKDYQSSYDTFNHKEKEFSGALTMVLIELIKNNNNILMNSLLTNLRNNLRRRGFDQIPQLTSNKKIENNLYFSKIINNSLELFINHGYYI